MPGLDHEALCVLAGELADRVDQPIDSLEIAAVLESLGVVDDVARDRYGAHHTFHLADAVYPLVRASKSDRPALPEDGPTPLPAHRDLPGSRCYLGALSPLLLPVLIAAYSGLGRWETGKVMALAAGMSGAVLVTNGFVLAIGRQSSILLSFGDRAGTRRFLALATAAAAGVVATVAGLIAVGTALLGLLTEGERSVLVLGFLGLAAIWLLSAGLAALRATDWLAASLAGGLLIGVVVDRAFVRLTATHLELGTLFGLSAAVALIIWPLRRGLRRTEADRVVLPPLAFLLLKAGPYLAYGTCYAAFILLPHVHGWLAILATHHASRVAALTSLELGLTLSMVPLLVAAGWAERTLSLFWREVVATQAVTPAGEPSRPATAMARLHESQLGRYLIVLGVVSLVVKLVFSQTLDAGWFTGWGLELGTRTSTVFVLDGGLLAHGVLGFGLFETMFTLALGRPADALRAVLLGSGVTVLIGLSLLRLGVGFEYAPLVFLAGCLAFAWASRRGARRLLREPDYYVYAES